MAEIVVDGENATLTLTYTALATNLDAYVTDAISHKYWPDGPVLPGDEAPTPIDQLTPQNKADLIEGLAAELVLDYARRFYVDKARRDAQGAAQTAIENRYGGLG